MFLSQNSDYSIISSNEAASIICRFTPEMIQNIVDEALTNKYRNYSQTLSNIVESLETNYKMMKNGLPDYANEIEEQKTQTYMQIINKVCTFHNLQFIFHEGDNLYSSAFFIYDFLIAQSNLYIINFFVNYINREKGMIYETLELASKKKDASAYSKKLYKNSNSKLATIHANLEFVLENIWSYDIPFETFVELACIPDREKARYLTYILEDKGDFFIRVIVPYCKQNYATLTTEIKFGLQGFASAEFADLV